MQIRFPNQYTTPEQRYAYLYRLQELLRQDHNIMADKLKAGLITKRQFELYRVNTYNPKSDILIEHLLNYRSIISNDINIKAALTDFY